MNGPCTNNKPRLLVYLFNEERFRKLKLAFKRMIKEEALGRGTRYCYPLSEIYRMLIKTLYGVEPNWPPPVPDLEIIKYLFLELQRSGKGEIITLPRKHHPKVLYCFCRSHQYCVNKKQESEN